MVEALRAVWHATRVHSPHAAVQLAGATTLQRWFRTCKHVVISTATGATRTALSDAGQALGRGPAAPCVCDLHGSVQRQRQEASSAAEAGAPPCLQFGALRLAAHAPRCRAVVQPLIRRWPAPCRRNRRRRLSRRRRCRWRPCPSWRAPQTTAATALSSMAWGCQKLAARCSGCPPRSPPRSRRARRRRGSPPRRPPSRRRRWC